MKIYKCAKCGEELEIKGYLERYFFCVNCGRVGKYKTCEVKNER